MGTGTQNKLIGIQGRGELLRRAGCGRQPKPQGMRIGLVCHHGLQALMSTAAESYPIQIEMLPLAWLSRAAATQTEDREAMGIFEKHG